MLRKAGSGWHEKDGCSLVPHAEYRRAVEASGDPQGALFYFNLQSLSKIAAKPDQPYHDVRHGRYLRSQWD